MTNFFTVLGLELKKVFTQKSIIGLLIGLAIVLFIGIIMCELLFGIIEGLQDWADTPGVEIEEGVDPDLPSENSTFGYTGQALDELIDSQNLKISILKADMEADKSRPIKERVRYFTQSNNLYNLEAQKTAMEYCRDNGIEYSESLLQPDAPSLAAVMDLLVSMLLIIAGIFAIVSASRLVADEWKRGTLKVSLIRPVTREQVLGAKLLASFIGGFAVFFVGMVVVIIYALIKYAGAGTEMLYVFNATSAFMASDGLYVFLCILSQMTQIAIYASFAFCVATLTRNNVVSVLLPLLSFFGIGGFIFSFANLGPFLLSSNVNSMAAYFSAVGTPNFYPMNFWWSFVALILYLGIFITSSFLVLKKRDIA